MRLIETDAFPIEFVSALAARESWRKELHRPIYHVHKWWATRLGSAFRGILLGCLLPENGDLRSEFYVRRSLSSTAVFDPFMGSGTTVGEAHKLGCIALGRDINPVACESARIGLGSQDVARLRTAYEKLTAAVGNRINNLYRSTDKQGYPCDVLYYFWVMQATCPSCRSLVDLFPSRVLARSAAPNHRDHIQVCCPQCGDVFRALDSETHIICPTCSHGFSPNVGVARRTEAECPVCSCSFPIAKAMDASAPPAYRLYAKLVLTGQGKKVYLAATQEDIAAYLTCSAQIHSEMASGSVNLPVLALGDGYNTRQAMSYGFTQWRDFFNDRQLLALNWLQQAIANLGETPERDALLLLFSGILEFNNRFASYKGEGTGAVRHMFSHHILKPERMPIEANPWGMPSSSGAFSTLFSSRLLRAVNYQRAPFELAENSSRKVYGASAPFSDPVNCQWPVSGCLSEGVVYLSCGSSQNTGLATGSVDYVVTDPPFYDNVNYSELADFFYAWQSLHSRGFVTGANTTRHECEVQDAKPEAFAQKLEAVFAEARRVLKDEGLLVFTFHHSKGEGWEALAQAVFGAGFSVVNAHPIKSELSVAAPKQQAREPIQIDIVLVCCKQLMDKRAVAGIEDIVREATPRFRTKIDRLERAGLQLSRADRRVIALGQLLAGIGPGPAHVAIQALRNVDHLLDQTADDPPQTNDAPSLAPTYVALRLW